MKKTIGLCLAYKGTNYGSLLQAYATQHIIESYGFDTEIIDYTVGRDHRFIVSPEVIGYLLVSKARSLIKKNNKQSNETYDELHLKNIAERKKVADEFRNIFLHNIIKVDGFENLQNESKKYDAVLVGSDQLWEPNVSFSYFYSLMFAPEGIRRISYATSTGVDRYPWYVKRQASKFLKRIDFLSVREEHGKKIIKQVSGRDAKLVLDPTYLITKEEWETLIPNQEITKKGYVLSFLLGDNPQMKKLAKKYAEEHGLRLVSILSNETNSDDSELSDEILIGQKPANFLNLIRNAECIFTDSFHAFTFSIINEREVFIIYRVRKGLGSRNSRIDNIVARLGIEDRLIKNPNTFIFNNNKIEYDKVKKKIEKYRKESKEFLDKCLTFE